MTDYDLDSVVSKAVEGATNEDSFDALEFFSEASLPEDTVTLYRDTATALRLNSIHAEREQAKVTDENEGLSIDDEDGYVDDDEVSALTEKLKKSAVTFSLQAISPSARSALEKAARAKNPFKEGQENDAYWEAFNGNLIAKSIVSVSNAAGKKDTNAWDIARVLKFAEVTEPSEWQKVFNKVYELNFVSDAIDRAVNADF